VSTSGTGPVRPYFEAFASLSPRNYGTHEDATVRFSLEQPLPPGVIDRMITARRDEIDAAL